MIRLMPVLRSFGLLHCGIPEQEALVEHSWPVSIRAAGEYARGIGIIVIARLRGRDRGQAVLVARVNG
jgi:hypothetical protein